MSLATAIERVEVGLRETQEINRALPQIRSRESQQVLVGRGLLEIEAQSHDSTRSFICFRSSRVQMRAKTKSHILHRSILFTQQPRVNKSRKKLQSFLCLTLSDPVRPPTAPVTPVGMVRYQFLS